LTMERGLSVRKAFLLTFAGLLVFILYLYFFVGFSSIIEVWENVNLANYLFYYSLTVVALVLSVLFYSMTWHELLKLLSVKISLRNAFLYCWLASFIDLVIPLETVTGEITRIYLAARNSEGHTGRIVASVASQRILSAIVVLAGLTISSASLAFAYKVHQYVLSLLMVVQIGTVATILLILFFYLRKEATERFVDSLLKLANFIFKGRLKQADLRTKAHHALASFYQGIEVIRSRPRGLIKPLIFNFAAWFFHFIIYILVFFALDFNVSLDVSLIVYSVSVSVQYLPIALPVGLVEIVMASLYNLFGIPPPVGGTATALIRIITFWFQIIVGFAIAQWIGIKTLTQRKVTET